MNKTLYSVLNPMVKVVLGSPLHRLMSGNTALLEFRGRKSGKTYKMPVSYHETGQGVHIFTEKSNVWWRNLQGGDDVKLRLRGQDHTGRPRVEVETSAQKREALAAFLVATPRDAAHAGVSFDADGRFSASDIAEASERLVHVVIDLVDAQQA